VLFVREIWTTGLQAEAELTERRKPPRRG